MRDTEFARAFFLSDFSRRVPTPTLANATCSCRLRSLMLRGERKARRTGRLRRARGAETMKLFSSSSSPTPKRQVSSPTYGARFAAPSAARFGFHFRLDAALGASYVCAKGRAKRNPARCSSQVAIEGEPSPSLLCPLSCVLCPRHLRRCPVLARASFVPFLVPAFA
jgi:hypothetical protein